MNQPKIESQSQGHLLLFDGVCNFCNGSVQFIIKRDKRAIFQFASLQSETGREYLKKYHLPVEDFDTIMYIRNEQCLMKSTAIIHILFDLGGWWKMAYIGLILPKFLRDAIYSVIAKNRYKWFGKQEFCMIPTPEVRKRFL